jgi:hypothetical protein
MALEWLPGALLAVAGSGLAFWRSISVSEARLDLRVNALEATQKAAQMDYAAIGAKLERASEQMTAAAGSFQAAQASQTVINGFTTKVLDSLASKLETQEKQVNEHSSTLALVREWISKGGHNR